MTPQIIVTTKNREEKQPYENLGHLLNRYRMDRKPRRLTEKELAAKVGISPDTYSNYERGKDRPSYETLCRLGIELHIPCKTISALAYPKYKDYINADDTLWLPSDCCQKLNEGLEITEFNKKPVNSRLMEYAIRIMNYINQQSNQ